MSRTTGKAQRLRLFAAGNAKCPICLTPFTEGDVRRGAAVTLARARARAVAQSRRDRDVPHLP